MIRLAIFLLLFLLVDPTSAQERISGLLTADDKYQSIQELPLYSGAKYNEIPLRVNLKKYAPVAGDQLQTGACVGFAVGYHALTILRARQQSLTDQAVITAVANSAAFIYNQVRQEQEDCTTGAFIEDALDLLLHDGDCLARSFSLAEQGCEAKPDAQLQQEANAYRIKDFARLFGPNELSDQKLLKACKVLASEFPVVVGVQVDFDV